MTQHDLNVVAELYVSYMYDSLYAQLGYDFIRAMISGLLAARGEISLVAERDHRIAGFITVAENSSRTSRELLVRKGLALAWRAALACLKKPSLLKLLLQTGEYFKKTGARLDAAQAEMIFITVDPAYRRQRIGEKLIAAVLQEYRLRGVRRVKVTTIKSNQPVQQLLQRLGFTLRGYFAFYGKEMALFARDLR